MPSSPSSSSANKGGLDSELESFRRQWISDIQHQHEHEHEHDHDHDHDHPPQAPQQSRPPAPAPAPATAPGPSRRRGPSISARPPPQAVPKVDENDEDEFLQGQAYDEPAPPTQVRHEVRGGVSTRKKLASALDHYEAAMAKEAQGNMGDSLKLYRIAYRMDNCVDQRYREKHFPKKMPSTQPAGSSTIINNTSTPIAPPSTVAPAATADADVEAKPLSIGELIASFASLKIEPVPPEVEGMPQPPCPIAELPDEILTHILRDVAVADVADFARLSRVCKRLAYLVASEQRIWRLVTVGSEFGFGNMKYRFEKGISWDDLGEEEQDQVQVIDGFVLSPSEVTQRRRDTAMTLTESLTPAVYPTWKSHFRSRPRIRFNGCYISTVNYVRTGQASTNQNTWGGAPIHIVTYYRYLRFFRDGTLISLLTTQEPSEVVHHLTRHELYLHRDAAHRHLPSAVMALALKGRWRLSSAEDRQDPEASTSRGGRDDPEGDLFIETEGVGSKYIYRMDLSLGSAGKGSRNNKLTWRGFYNYNKLTDDWGEFGLKNYKPFFFSRVKSYGLGE